MQHKIWENFAKSAEDPDREHPHMHNKPNWDHTWLLPPRPVFESL